MDHIDSGTSRRRTTRRRLAAGVIALASIGALTAGQPAQAATRASAWWRTANCGGTVIYKADGTPWTCSFDDEFSGRSIDTTKWYVGNTANDGFYDGDSCMQPSAVSVSNGELRITSRDTGTAFTCNTPTGSFTTRDVGGSIATSGHFAQTYGRYEVRARFPQSGASANAFWLYPAALTYGAWPASGEIDVAEWWSNTPNMVLPTLHYTGSTTDDSGWSCGVTDPTIWHTYTVVWQPTVMTFSIDGQTCFTRSWSPLAPLIAPQPFDQPFNMVLTAAVNSTSNNPATTVTTTPASYEVDYARAWK